MLSPVISVILVVSYVFAIIRFIYRLRLWNLLRWNKKRWMVIIWKGYYFSIITLQKFTYKSTLDISVFCCNFSFSVEFTQPSEIAASLPRGSLTIVPYTKENLDAFVLMPTPAQRGMAKGQLRSMKIESGGKSLFLEYLLFIANKIFPRIYYSNTGRIR